jgi:hypothetical protein
MPVNDWISLMDDACIIEWIRFFELFAVLLGISLIAGYVCACACACACY